MPATHIPYYLDYLSLPILRELEGHTEPVDGVAGLRVTRGLREQFATIETIEALRFVCELYQTTRVQLARVLAQRAVDRSFIDKGTIECAKANRGIPFDSPDYATVIGRRDANGRIVVGPQPEPIQASTVHIPDYMAGEHVTLFGPPDTAKMSINAMNTLHHRLPGEAPIVARLVESSGEVPRWGADNEDSKTPMVANLLSATENLIGCFNRTLRFDDPKSGKAYVLADSGLSKPIKRIPGLALPDGNHLFEGNPLPLHLLDFALHLFHNRRFPEALVFYVPKLENEEEAAYLHQLIHTAEGKIKEIEPDYVLGTVKIFIVFESPRSIFRIREMAQTLHPYFLGGSLGWHDFLGSTARLFKNDPNYRIPVKADPNIVINHIRESHQILVDALRPLGAITIGGMYGVLYEDGNAASFDVSMVGYIKDVTTQLKRGLTGFWVAHPNFVRLGIALVEAWRRHERDPQDPSLAEFIRALVTDEDELGPLLDFVFGDDIPGLSPGDPLYERGVLAADIEISDFMTNDDPREVRYNVFQAIQYLADWLSGNGCVALPAVMTNIRGEDVFVRIMDDLATTERSRWELWAEIHHGRVSVELFEEILAEEITFIRNNSETPTKRVQVRWEGEAARWYPMAEKLLRQLVTDPEPVEFATELLMPFTLDFVRGADDPWSTVCKLCPGKYR
jgi:malate synthase